MNEIPGDSDDERLDRIVDAFRTMSVPPCPNIDLRRLPALPRRAVAPRRTIVVCIMVSAVFVFFGVFFRSSFQSESARPDVAEDSPDSDLSKQTQEPGNRIVANSVPAGLIERSPVVERALDDDLSQATVGREISAVISDLDLLARRVAVKAVREPADVLVQSIRQLVAAAD